MRGIAKFYTWFWIIYFPVCIAFTVAVNFDYSDEFLTVLLLFYVMSKRRFWVKDMKREKEITACIFVMLFYLVYSFLISITTPRGIWLDIMQQARPYMVFYLTWMMAPHFDRRQKKRIKLVMLVSFFGYLILFFVAPSMVNPYGGVLNGGESAALGQIALCCAMIYYLFSPQTKKNKYIAIGIMVLGLVGGKSKYFGEVVVFIALVAFLKEKVKFNSSKFYLQVVILAVIVLFFTWTKFSIYYVEGFQEDAQEMARPLTYRTSLKIMFDYIPFGTGYGTFGCAAAAKEYSPLYYKYHLDHVWGLTPELPMFLADAFYPIYPAQFGIVGILCFLVFWKRRIREANAIQNMAYYRMAMMCILALALEQTADSSYLSGKGMGYFMILALCLNSHRYWNNSGNHISKLVA
jgi:hypothetical protein